MTPGIASLYHLPCRSHQNATCRAGQNRGLATDVADQAHAAAVGAAMSEHRKARGQGWPTGGGEQERAGQATGEGEVGDDVERLRGSGCRDIQ